MSNCSVCVTADSTCDLSSELLSQYGIDTLPLYVVMEGKAYKDGVEITPDDIYAKVKATGKIGSTAAINVDEYLTFFTEKRKTCDALIHFTISSEMSSCFQNANIATREVGGVYVIDSRSLSTGMGLLVLRACELAQKGMAAEVIVSAINAMTEKVEATFVPDNLEYLKMGGRCSAAAALSATLLRIHPCIQVREGKMGVGKKPHPEYDLAAWVLSRFKNDEVEPLKSAAKNACDAIKLIVGEKIDMAMNKFNS